MEKIHHERTETRNNLYPNFVALLIMTTFQPKLKQHANDRRAEMHQFESGQWDSCLGSSHTDIALKLWFGRKIMSDCQDRLL